jgi:hypothetical protein
VSDEFTVPLCSIHHHEIHTTGKEREWWQQRNIDPLKVAAALWQQSRARKQTDLTPASGTAAPREREASCQERATAGDATSAGESQLN